MDNKVTIFQDILGRRNALQINFTKWKYKWNLMLKERNDLSQKVDSLVNSLNQLESQFKDADFDINAEISRKSGALKNYEEQHTALDKQRDALLTELNTLVAEAKNMVGALDEKTSAIAAICIGNIIPKTIQ